MGVGAGEEARAGLQREGPGLTLEQGLRGL